MRAVIRPLPLTAISALVGGCTAQGSFPSLAPRAVERDFAGTDQPVPPCLSGAEAREPVPEATPTPTGVDPVLAARIEQIRTAAREGDRAFEEAMAEASAAVSTAGAPGTDSWIAAQVAVSEAEMARTPTATAVAELTNLALEESNQPPNPLDQQAIEDAAAEAQGLANRQAERLEVLKASLSEL